MKVYLSPGLQLLPVPILVGPMAVGPAAGDVAVASAAPADGAPVAGMDAQTRDGASDRAGTGGSEEGRSEDAAVPLSIVGDVGGVPVGVVLSPSSYTETRDVALTSGTRVDTAAVMPHYGAGNARLAGPSPKALLPTLVVPGTGVGSDDAPPSARAEDADPTADTLSGLDVPAPALRREEQRACDACFADESWTAQLTAPGVPAARVPAKGFDLLAAAAVAMLTAGLSGCSASARPEAGARRQRRFLS
jgi:hypothetical protein